MEGGSGTCGLEPIDQDSSAAVSHESDDSESDDSDSTHDQTDYGSCDENDSHSSDQGDDGKNDQSAETITDRCDQVYRCDQAIDNSMRDQAIDNSMHYQAIDNSMHYQAINHNLHNQITDHNSNLIHSGSFEPLTPVPDEFTVNEVPPSDDDDFSLAPILGQKVNYDEVGMSKVTEGLLPNTLLVPVFVDDDRFTIFFNKCQCRKLISMSIENHARPYSTDMPIYDTEEFVRARREAWELIALSFYIYGGMNKMFDEMFAALFERITQDPAQIFANLEIRGITLIRTPSGKVLNFLSTFLGVTTLTFDHVTGLDLAVLNESDVYGISRLVITNCGLTELPVLHRFRKLSHLNLNGNPIKKFNTDGYRGTPGLPYLRWLAVDNVGARELQAILFSMQAPMPLPLIAPTIVLSQRTEVWSNGTTRRETGNQ